jgi:pentatricopeptide repeat protein
MGKVSHTLSRLGAAQAKAGDTEAAEAVLREMDENSIPLMRWLTPNSPIAMRCLTGMSNLRLKMRGAWRNSPPLTPSPPIQVWLKRARHLVLSDYTTTAIGKVQSENCERLFN